MRAKKKNERQFELNKLELETGGRFFQMHFVCAEKMKWTHIFIILKKTATNLKWPRGCLSTFLHFEMYPNSVDRC